MHASFRRSPAAPLILIIGLASLSGCSSPRPLSGRRILEELEAARVQVPDERGSAPAPPAPARLPGEGPIRLADLMNAAEAGHPRLAAARSAVGIAAGQEWQASLYPNPRVDIEAEDVSLRSGAGEGKAMVWFTQPIVLGGRRQAAVLAAAAERDARSAEIESERRVLFGQVAQAYTRLVSLREQAVVYTQLREVVGRTLEQAQARFEARAAPETDVIRPRVELYRIDAALGRLREEQAAAVRQLGTLVGTELDPARIAGGLPADLPSIDVAALSGALKSDHPVLLASEREVEAAEARLALRRAELTPDLELRVAAGYRGENDDGVVEFGAGMTVPLWDRGQGDLLSRRFEVMRARQQRAAAELDLLGRLAEAVGEHEAARVQLITFRDQIVPDAQRAFDQVTEGYRGGRSTFLDMLDAQRTLAEAKVTLVELASAAMAARARVAEVAGPALLDQRSDTPQPRSPEFPVPIPSAPSGRGG